MSRYSLGQWALVGLLACSSFSAVASGGRLIALMDNDGVFQGGTVDIVSQGSAYLFEKFNDEHRQHEDDPIPFLPADFVPRQYVHKEYAEHLDNHDVEDCFCHMGTPTRISEHLGHKFTDELFGINTHYEDHFATPDDFPHEPFAVEGGAQFLDYLNDNEVPWALVSNGYSNFAIRAWKTTGLLDRRNDAPIVFPENLESMEHSKPHQRHLETALYQLDVKDDESVTIFMLGDSLKSDIEAAYRLAREHDSYEVHAIYFTKEHPEHKKMKIDSDVEVLANWEAEQPNFKSTICHNFDEVQAYVDTLRAG